MKTCTYQLCKRQSADTNVLIGQSAKLPPIIGASLEITAGFRPWLDTVSGGTLVFSHFSLCYFRLKTWEVLPAVDFLTLLDWCHGLSNHCDILFCSTASCFSCYHLPFYFLMLFVRRSWIQSAFGCALNCIVSDSVGVMMELVVCWRRSVGVRCVS